MTLEEQVTAFTLLTKEELLELTSLPRFREQWQQLRQ